MLRSVMSRCVPCYTEWKCTTYYLLTYYYLYNIGVSGCYALSHRCLPCLNLKWHH